MFYLLFFNKVITSSALQWQDNYGQYLYLILSVGLLLLAMLAFIVGGTANGSTIDASQSPVGLRLFHFWMLQNSFIGIASVASVLILYIQLPPEFRKILIPPVMW
jgi:uncharacterized BrkB/YihY/UPF0761 family membrane protein